MWSPSGVDAVEAPSHLTCRLPLSRPWVLLPPSPLSWGWRRALSKWPVPLPGASDRSTSVPRGRRDAQKTRRGEDPMCLFTQTSAMPGRSFSLPARRTCPGAFFAPDAVCTSCYADGRNRYRFDGVRTAQERRLRWTFEALEAGRFVSVLVDGIGATSERYFRIHDSGDFFSPQYVQAWREIALALPSVSFWAPTRSWALQGQARQDKDPLLISLRKLAQLSNVTVRPSVLLIDGEPPVVPGLASGTSVTKEVARATCPKFLRHPPSCGFCRRCWDEPELTVVYLKH